MNDCICMKPPLHYSDFDSVEVGIDKTNGRFGQVNIKTCRSCGRKWLDYYVEVEAFPESGRWYRGLLSDETTAELENMQQQSILLSDQCRQKGYPFFDTSLSFTQVIDQAARYLISGSRNGNGRNHSVEYDN